MDKTEDIPKDRRRWVGVDLQGSRFHNVDLRGSVIRGAFLTGVELDGHVDGLVVNGVDVSSYVKAELDARDPLRAQVRSRDLVDLREAWSGLRTRWAATTERAAALDDGLVDRQVDEEWSFAETLRHLVFVTDAWLRRCVLGELEPFHPIGLPITDMPPFLVEACAIDLRASPTFAEVLDARADRQAAVTAFLDRVTDAELDRPCPRNPSRGHPLDTTRIPVRGCVAIVLREELAHHNFAVRDLDRLEVATT